MKAWVLHGINDIRLENVVTPIIKQGEALVKVKCISICSSDLMRVFSTGAYYYPLILGHEFSGVVEECDNSEWIGRRVSVFPLLPCFECESCKQGHYETCSHYGYLGSRQDGGFAEYVVVPTWNLQLLPDYVSYEEAALFEPAAVSLHAVKMLSLGHINGAAVVGSGAIGLLIAQWLNIYSNIEATVIGRNSENSDRFDACFEAVGSKVSIENSIEITRPNGQLVLVGNPEENFKLERQIYWKILRKQLKIRGSWNSSNEADWREVAANINKLYLDNLISHRYKFDDLGAALSVMYSRQEKRCKVIVNI